MRLTLTLFLLTISLSLSSARNHQHTSVLNSDRSINDPDYTQSDKSLDDERDIKRVQIYNQIGLDGKVRRIHLDSNEEDKPGIRAYGLPKKHFQDNGIIERLQLGEDRIRDDTFKSGRLVEAYGIPKNKMESNGFIERLPLSSIGHQVAKLDSRNENVRIRRSIRTGSEDKVEKKVTSEAEDMQAQDSKVFRPLFVHRQQVAARERRKHARNVLHRNHRHTTHQPCYHHRVTN
ncbi:PREDICTED: uncharacterized protein LOC108745443 [Trachymyrmex septentrionalis]|uniref:uncharacterized protein LOC108745443 n=1 Tax=Trachymyrmex septentrionalis TaxID=34720 RepID=UPI00084EE475|nr:PREDICTED: uncharacterized protein LOC108745443 [Trachymyrmex septentrionalis]